MSILNNVQILVKYQDEINKFIEMDKYIDSFSSIENCMWVSFSSGIKYISEIGEKGLYLKLIEELHNVNLI